MNTKFKKIEHLEIIILTIVLLGTICAYYNLGFLSVFFSVSFPIILILIGIIAIYGLFKRKYAYIILTAIILFINQFSAHLFSENGSSSDNNTESISILSYNVRAFEHLGITAGQKNAQNKIIKFIDSINPDICILQESAYKNGINITGYDYQFLNYRAGIKKTLLAIYSKYPIIEKGHIDFPNTLNNAIYADLLIKQDTVRIYNTHMQSYRFQTDISLTAFIKNINSVYSKQIEQSKVVKHHAEEFKNSVIICGDFNATPYSLPYKILKKGLSDSFSLSHHIFGKTFSLFNYPMRLDYLIFDDSMKVQSHRNFNLKASDHEPILANFKFQ